MKNTQERCRTRSHRDRPVWLSGIGTEVVSRNSQVEISTEAVENPAEGGVRYLYTHA